MLEISEMLYEAAVAFARAGGFANDCIATIISLVSLVYWIAYCLMPFCILHIAINAGRKA